MSTALFLLMFTVATEFAAAQNPVPAKPRPAPAPHRGPVTPHVPAPADAALVPLIEQLDHLRFELPHLPAMEQWEFQRLAVPFPPVMEHWDFPQHLLAPEPLFPPLHFPDVVWPESNELGQGSLSRARPDQGTPEDSLFRAAREALSRGEYARASSLFQSFEQRFPRSRVAPSALYWRAFALYRSGASDELRTALEALKTQQDRYPQSANDPDAAALRTRVYAALASRGDAQAASALRAANAAGSSCDREEMEVRAEALNALAQLDAPEARPTLKRVLARRDECSAPLRRRAVYILGRSGTEESAADLLDVAKNDPDPSVRSDAIMLIGRASGTASVKVLEQIFNESTDERTRQAALSALRSRGGPEAKRALRAIIEKGDLPERVRAEAILQLGRSSDAPMELNVGGQLRTIKGTVGDEEDAAFLRGLYGKTDSRTVKSAILASVGRIGGSANDQWLLGIAKNRAEETSLRREALSRLKTSALSIEELGKLFDAMPERDLRYAVVSQLASRDDSAAVDKLIEIARSGTDPQIRRQAIAALAQKKDPRTTKLLLDLVEKP